MPIKLRSEFWFLWSLLLSGGYLLSAVVGNDVLFWKLDSISQSLKVFI